jgi:hypothetical protein
MEFKLLPQNEDVIFLTKLELTHIKENNYILKDTDLNTNNVRCSIGDTYCSVSLVDNGQVIDNIRISLENIDDIPANGLPFKLEDINVIRHVKQLARICREYVQRVKSKQTNQEYHSTGVNKMTRKTWRKNTKQAINNPGGYVSYNRYNMFIT